MIPTLEILVSIDNKVNKLSSLNGQFIPNETKIDLINKAQIKLVLKKLGLNNSYQMGMDSYDRRYEDLQNLQMPHEKLTLVENSTDLLNSYKVPFSSLTKDMLIFTNAYVLATKGNCKDRVLDIIDFVKHSDLRLKLKSPHYSPNFDCQETIATITNDIIYVYRDQKKTFTLSDLYLSYLRYPIEVDIAGYIHLDGTVSVNRDCELESYLADELVDLVVEEIADATGNNEQSQLSRTRLKENE